MHDTYDVVIVGAGIGGLFCGCYLAKAGMRVLIIEKHDKPGGCVTSIIRKKSTFDMGAHLIGSCGDRGLFTKYLRDLDIDMEFIHLNPTDRFHFLDRTIDVSQDIDIFSTNLKKMFPKEAKNIDPFFKEMVKIATNYDNKRILDLYQDYSFEDFLNKYFEDVELKGILSSQFYYIGVIPKKASALSMCLMMVSYLRDGSYFVRRGSQNLPHKLTKRFLELKGDLLLKLEAKKIEIHLGKAVGVYANNGRLYRARYIVSNIDSIRTIFELIGIEHFPEEYIDKIRSYTIGKSFFLMFLVANIPTNCLANVSGWYHSSYNLNDQKTDSFYIFVPTYYDRSLNIEDLHNIELAMPFPYEYDNVDDWSKIKSELEENLLNKASQVLLNFKENIVYKFSATPKTIEHFTGNSKGSLYGWEMSVNQVQRYRLDNECNINNLFFVGHWTKPGCGVVSVATSGWKVAKKILETEQLK